ncbi:hypothetical protein [Burkholderia sp. BCC0044]|nr:hypothetical protein [Burkholderia sp. BCC0044]
MRRQTFDHRRGPPLDDHMRALDGDGPIRSFGPLDDALALPRAASLKSSG